MKINGYKNNKHVGYEARSVATTKYTNTHSSKLISVSLPTLRVSCPVTLPGLLKLNYLLQLLHDGVLHNHLVKAGIRNNSTIKVLHPQTPWLLARGLSDKRQGYPHLWTQQ